MEGSYYAIRTRKLLRWDRGVYWAPWRNIPGDLPWTKRQLTPRIGNATTITFDEIKDGLDRLKRGGVKGRLVALI